MCLAPKPPKIEGPPPPPPPPPETKPMEMTNVNDPKKQKRIGTKRLQVSMDGAGSSGLGIPS